MKAVNDLTLMRNLNKTRACLISTVLILTNCNTNCSTAVQYCKNMAFVQEHISLIHLETNSLLNYWLIDIDSLFYSDNTLIKKAHETTKGHANMLTCKIIVCFLLTLNISLRGHYGCILAKKGEFVNVVFFCLKHFFNLSTFRTYIHFIQNFFCAAWKTELSKVRKRLFIWLPWQRKRIYGLKPFNFFENVLPSIPQFLKSLKSCPRSKHYIKARLQSSQQHMCFCASIVLWLLSFIELLESFRL